MDKLFVLDIGGTTIKMGFWHNQQLEMLDKVPTPKTWPEMLAAIVQVKETLPDVQGTAISCPGVVDTEKGIIYGSSAISYIHNFPIRKALVDALGVPVSLQNDANSAALAELWQGNARDVADCLLFVVGTGVGGAVILNRQLRAGANLFAGEFGYMILDQAHRRSISDLGTPVKMAERFSQVKGEAFDGKAVFDLADQGDALAQEYVDEMYNALSCGIYNQVLAIDPQRVLIGGAISSRAGFVSNVRDRVAKLITEHGADHIQLDIQPCKFRGNANLLGAIYQFQQEHPE